MNKYIKPSINVVTIAAEASLLAATIDTQGLSEPIQYGGPTSGTTTHEVGAKPFTSENLWDDENAE